MSIENKNITLNNFKQIIKNIFLYKYITYPNNKWFLKIGFFFSQKYNPNLI